MGGHPKWRGVGKTKSVEQVCRPNVRRSQEVPILLLVKINLLLGVLRY